ncbi:hypothetical protein ACN4EG_27305 [Alkalinema pantanalense CENA528]|uniref:hypothetical protein n=1 Tax=Alkalinema pantanalense TaxID=1620705 RepID=UPI003D6E040F
MEKIAQTATKAALTGYDIPPEVRSLLVLGTVFMGDFVMFELYIPTPRPQDAIVISQATVSRMNGEVKVDVFLNENRSAIEERIKERH